MTDAADRSLADGAAGWAGAYVHIPFCRRVCPYCDFAVVEGAGDLRSPYLDALLAEIAGDEPFPRPLDAVFVGGGTPTSLDPADLGRLVGALDERFGLASHAEVSLEANPEDVIPSVAWRLVEAGFNRISLGVQSFDDMVLDSLGRRHRPEDAEGAIRMALAAFPSVNVDLIFGTPGESLGSWKATVDRALESGIQHLSAYALTVERGTPLGRAVLGGAPAPDPDDQADKYEYVAAAAADAGLTRYETSNFSLPGHRCRYNLLTWAQGEYAAFGNGAHRHRRRVRSWNVRRVDRYIERAATNPRSGEERIEGWAREIERVSLGLRRATGVVAGVAGSALLATPEGERLVEAGIVAESDGHIVVTRPLLGDEVARALLALGEPATVR
ncbi:MAG TPA: radical SAM family heme chaperone HemW [Acidimicrobiia bacterium]|nr:radical SAM family heme chaperone HemW [Acidimicrobiia bacterium]